METQNQPAMLPPTTQYLRLISWINKTQQSHVLGGCVSYVSMLLNDVDVDTLSPERPKRATSNPSLRHQTSALKHVRQTLAIHTIPYIEQGNQPTLSQTPCNFHLTTEQSVGSSPSSFLWLMFWSSAKGTNGSFATTIPAKLAQIRPNRGGRMDGGREERYDTRRINIQTHPQMDGEREAKLNEQNTGLFVGVKHRRPRDKRQS